MQCHGCCEPVLPDWRFCPHCGADVPGPRAISMSDLRGQVLEIIVKQAIMGAPWKTICAGPMQIHKITPEEVEKEVELRQKDGKKPTSSKTKTTNTAWKAPF